MAKKNSLIKDVLVVYLIAMNNVKANEAVESTGVCDLYQG